MTSRQRWIMAQLADGVKLTRAMVEERFAVGAKQAKRELAGLSAQGLIEFKRKPKPGYYVLQSKAGSVASSFDGSSPLKKSPFLLAGD